MYQYKPAKHEHFDILDAIAHIAAAAGLYHSKGREYIWVYLKDGKVQCHVCPIKCLDKYFVGHYTCRSILSGSSNREWDSLERNLVRVYLESR